MPVTEFTVSGYRSVRHVWCLVGDATVDAPAFEAALQTAFPGAALEIDRAPHAPVFSVSMRTPGVHRALSAQELSDGTMQYLCLVTALLSPRPPGLLALNEPEASIHPDLFPSLAQLIERAARRSQVWITTHAEPLARAVGDLTGVPAVPLEKVDGETRVANQSGAERKFQTR